MRDRIDFFCFFSWDVLNIVVVSVDNDDDDDDVNDVDVNDYDVNDVNDVDVDPNAGVVIGVVGRDVDQGEIEPSLETTCGCGFTNCKNGFG